MSDCFPVQTSRRIIENPNAGLARREAVSQVLVPVDAVGPNDPVVLERPRAACAAGLEPTPADAGHGLEGHEYASTTQHD